ncbi:MAG: hypothetical protein MJ181_03035 [Treponema sp.]|nr:hypothetical protein [Treponema sp.]
MNAKTKKSFFAVLFAFFMVSAFCLDSPVVTNINAEYANGTKINIMWVNPVATEKPVTKYLIYRNTMPFQVFDDINKATFLAQLGPTATGYTDTVKDFNDYFYAVISFTDECCNLILPSMNATVTGVHVEAKKKNPVTKTKKSEKKAYPEGTPRETPLPILDLIEGINGTETQISKEASDKAASLGIKSKKEETWLEPYFFEEDMISPERGDAYYLFQILTGYFAPRDYEASIEMLKKLTGTNITLAVENRSLFYLGESYYFTGDFENAVRAFVKVQEYFPEESKRWLESSLDHLEL